MARRPTLKDVAQIARVSEMTASRVLRGKGEASAYTCDRVRDAAKTLGYVPNQIAGSLSSNRVNLVGVIVPSVSSSVFSEVLTGIINVLKETQLQPVFGVTGYDLDTEETVIRQMLSWQPSGVILAGLEHTETARRMLQNAGIPIAEIMDTDGDPVDMNIGISHEKAGYEMGQMFVERGYKKIGFIGTKTETDYRATKRLRGFERALSEANLSIIDREFYTGSSSLIIGKDITKMLLDRSPDLDCIYYSGDMMASGGLMHCLQNDISVPNQLGLAGFNGLDIREGLPALTATTYAFRKEIGEAAAKMIVAAKNSEKTRTGEKISFDPVIHIGDTL
ncbi:LacI family DNA-binding transcriptional regulator [Amylibacter sp. SFDW26]|uniref:LacI family DNA-binding transcriptional regulator n=1 Tax=Amylibacter sp. SFDW26 TaxID=2652722 RepID=UPI00126171A3|nr:LacI family DNA-binding transcriptional regulator [Amylibacter sp. SFDW26]KAB7614349.1 LacI family DNA-binding transcriptional regulator [Amylibacter sp. SFDW26]